MGFYVLCIVLFGVGFIKVNDWELSNFLGGCRVFSPVAIIFLIFIHIMLAMVSDAKEEKFDDNVKMIEASMSNKNITEQERKSTFTNIMLHNNSIKFSRRNKNNFFLGMFVFDWKCDKKLFEFADIPQVKYNILMETDTIK